MWHVSGFAFNNVHVRTIIILCFDRCRFDALCNLVKLFFSKCPHVRKRRKPNEELSTSKLETTYYRFSSSGTTKQSLKRKLQASRRENYRAEPEKKRTSRRARYRADHEKERTSRRARYRADPEKERAAKRQRYCHSPERASRSAKRVKVTQTYVVPLQPPSHMN